MPSNEVHHAIEITRNLIVSLSEATAVSENAMRIVFWISRAVVLRLSSIEDVLNRLLGLLSKSGCGSLSACGFGLLLSPDPILSKENGASIRLLAKQKVFNICIPAIAANFRNSNTSMRPNYLIALSGILKYLPTEVVMQEIDTLLPLLLQSLDLDDSDVKVATIQSLTVIGQEDPKAVEEHINSLVTRLLDAVSNPKANLPGVRLNALRCLRILPGRVKDSNLLRHKNAVTSGLTVVLDDPKRNVRKEAVECRASWLNMDEPQSD